MIGFWVCVFSCSTGFLLMWYDYKADKIDGSSKLITEEEKFKWSDILTFNRSFWYLCISCVMVYIGIFPFIQVVSDML